MYRSSLEQNDEIQLFEIPHWTSKQAPVAYIVRSAEKPTDNCAALLDLKLPLASNGYPSKWFVYEPPPEEVKNESEFEGPLPAGTLSLKRLPY